MGDVKAHAAEGDPKAEAMAKALSIKVNAPKKPAVESSAALRKMWKGEAKAASDKHFEHEKNVAEEAKDKQILSKEAKNPNEINHAPVNHKGPGQAGAGHAATNVAKPAGGKDAGKGQEMTAAQYEKAKVEAFKKAAQTEKFNVEQGFTHNSPDIKAAPNGK